MATHRDSRIKSRWRCMFFKLKVHSAIIDGAKEAVAYKEEVCVEETQRGLLVKITSTESGNWSNLKKADRFFKEKSGESQD